MRRMSQKQTPRAPRGASLRSSSPSVVAPLAGIGCTDVRYAALLAFASDENMQIGVCV